MKTNFRDVNYFHIININSKLIDIYLFVLWHW